MSKLTENFITIEDVQDTIDIVNSFELQDVKKALGDETFFHLSDVIDNLNDDRDSILLYGVMDKLLTTNRNSLVEYDEEYPILRKEPTTMEKDEIISMFITKKRDKNLDYLEEELPSIYHHKNIKVVMKAINNLYLLKELETLSLTQITIDVDTSILSLYKDGIEPEELVTSLYKLDKEVSKGNKEFTSLLENEDREPIEIINCLIDLSY